MGFCCCWVDKKVPSPPKQNTLPRCLNYWLHSDMASMSMPQLSWQPCVCVCVWGGHMHVCLLNGVWKQHLRHPGRNRWDVLNGECLPTHLSNSVRKGWRYHSASQFQLNSQTISYSIIHTFKVSVLASKFLFFIVPMHTMIQQCSDPADIALLTFSALAF